MTVTEYALKFDMLAEFASDLVPTDATRRDRFFRGLNPMVAQDVRITSVLGVTTYVQVIKNALTVEGVEDRIWRESATSRDARRMGGCMGFFVSVVDITREVPVGPAENRVVCEFLDVFPGDLPGLPPQQPIEFVIEVAPGIEPVSRVPYRMAPTKLKELKVQLQELLDLGFITPSFSPWGAPMLFGKKKDGALRMCINYK
ncbi:uncharacterized protein LOC133796005 [Humulus lupulus]|uniref:uncharacterized protein LOC133796005 n=1 Tax=Humulus lupulus TaxID=3486 RepID=UPI002B40C714|nr:uncharacterized protein LOC133796005 [Humulus lupulus]